MDITTDPYLRLKPALYEGHGVPYIDTREIYVARHGRDRATELGVHGRAPDLEDLVPRGITEMQTLARHIGREALNMAAASKGKEMVIIPYASYGKQCVQSANIFYEKVRQVVSDSPVTVRPPVLTNALNSFDFGPKFNGLTHKQIAERYPEYFKEFLSWKAGQRVPDRPPFPEESDPHAFYRQSCLALAEARDECLFKSVQIVNHSLLLAYNAIRHVIRSPFGSGLAKDGLPERIPYVDVAHGDYIAFDFGNEQLGAPLPNYARPNTAGPH